MHVHLHAPTHVSLSENPQARRRFIKEIQAARSVDRFCTAQVLDTDLEGDVSYVVNEYIDGPSLRETISEHGPMAGGQLERLAIGTATALVAIHRAAVVHRDFKPTNVIMGPDGPRVIDFGIARLLDNGPSSTSQMVGTPAYMAPEQFRGHKASRPADVFGWACTITYAATGETPFGSDYIPAVINRILNEPPDLGRLEGPLRELIASCLCKEPAARPTAPQVLARLLGEEDPPPPPVLASVPGAIPLPHDIDTTKPSIARTYDVVLNGKDNFEVDRAFVAEISKIIPEIYDVATYNRQILGRGVRHMVGQGIRQFLDLGSGLPTAQNTHHVAQAAAPDSRVVYVDCDPIVLSHGRALLAENDYTTVVQADIREPESILMDAEVRGFIDFDQPVAILLTGILHHLHDDEGPQNITEILMKAVPAGSYLFITHFCASSQDAIDAEQKFLSLLGTGRFRTLEEINAYFNGLDLLEPGIVPIPLWRPDRPAPDPDALSIGQKLLYGGIARKN
ncbi:SAM-dependent methyltransferase [Actinomadura madurae]|uniref:SAM-dependent methyltransferase n=1 Tax=Actinomadura madurae TaxID=1993 RepID=UPI00399B6923